MTDIPVPRGNGSQHDHTFTVPQLGLTVTVSPRASDGLVFVYLDTGDTVPDLHDRLRVRINDAELIALDAAANWVGGVNDDLRYGLIDTFTDPIPEEEP